MSNPFALLQNESEDPADNVAPPAKAAAPAPAASAQSAKPRQQNASSQPRGGNTRNAGPKKVFPGDRTPGTDAGEIDMTRDVRNERTAGQRGRGGSGAARGPRGGRGGRGSGGNRPMDRHSNTDRVDSHKQEHQAWGGDEGKRELADENEGEKDAQAAVSGVATPVGDAAPSTPIAAIPEAEAEDNTKTYQEWLAEQKKENIGGDLPQARKPNEGADDSQWKNAVAIKKEEDDEVLFAATKEAKARKTRQAKEKVIIEFEPNYPRPGSDRPERGRGGRGRGEGRGAGRGRGEGRGRGAARSSNGPTRGNAAPVDTSDSAAFPSLS